MSVEKILKNVQLPTLSRTLNAIIELERKNPISIFNDVIKVIEKDPMLSVHIMKIANSPLYGFAKSVRSISHAVSLVGITQIRNIAFSFSFFDFIKKIDYSKEYAKVFKAILKRSSIMSSIAGILAKNQKKTNSDELYLSGLISNLGQIVLFLYSPKKYSKIFTDRDSILELEKKEFGTDFIEIGVAFCEKEGLPAFIASAIKNQFILSEKTELNKIIYITSEITDFLLIEDKKLKTKKFVSLEKEVKKTLNLSMEDINNAIWDIPVLMKSFMSDFPEVQSELNNIINTSSEIIIDLMKNKLDMVLHSREQERREKQISNEKNFITNMLYLSKEFSVLQQPNQLINILIDFFTKNLEEYSINVLYKEQQKKEFIFFSKDKKINGKSIKIDSYEVLLESKENDEPLFLSKNNIKSLGLDPQMNQIVFPVSYHKNNFGFLIIAVETDLMKNVDYVISYIRIISNVIANSFQNYFSFINVKSEIEKKEKIANELIKNDEKLINYEANETILSRSNVLEEILPIIFHKLKNKMTPILGYSQLLISLSKNSSEVDKLKRIERNANELTGILESMSFGLKSEELKKKSENFNELMTKMEPFFLKIEKEKKIVIECDLNQSVKNVLLCRGQIITMIMNLIENSVNALEENDDNSKRIWIKTQLVDNIVKLMIKDNGIGIEKDNLQKVWTPFFSTYENKTGIGLTACEKVLLNHKAKYSFDSEVGVFTEFIAEFPVNEIEELNSNKKSKDKSKESVSNILIIDDELQLVILMKEILEIDMDLNIITVTKGEEALQLIEEHDFSVIISDIQMPGISGMDIFNYLKKKGIEDRLVMVTGNPYLKEISVFLKKNRIKYLRKPFELMEFRRLVNEKINKE